MAKGRMINRTISTDPKFNKLSLEAQWLYMRMLPFQDDYGRVTGNIFELRLLTIPSSAHTDEWVVGKLDELRKNNLINYEIESVIQFLGFDKNQKIGHRKAESLYPDIRRLAWKGQERSGKVTKGANNIIEPKVIQTKITKVKNGVSKQDTQPTLLQVFGIKFKEEFGAEYHAKFGKDGKQLKNLEIQFGTERVIKGIDYFFDVYIKTDKWAGKNVDVGGLYALWNKMVATGSKTIKAKTTLDEWAKE